MVASACNVCVWCVHIHKYINVKVDDVYASVMKQRLFNADQ